MTETAETLVQGTPEWREVRLGKITVSRFNPVRVQGKGARTYLLELVAEILTGQEKDTYTTKAMQWGIDNEAAARDVYEARTGLEVQEIGFVEHPLDPMIGGSPDGLVGTDGGLEIKCPYNTAVHIGYVLGDVLPKEHVAQVQGHLWNTGRKWWDFVSYDPRIKKPHPIDLALWRLRVERDEAYIANLETAVFAFRDKLLETLYHLKTGENRE